MIVRKENKIWSKGLTPFLFFKKNAWHKPTTESLLVNSHDIVNTTFSCTQDNEI